jgi:CheY-like chemotaxis protein
MPNPFRILIADDHADSRDLYAFALQRFGFEPIIAADGEEALAKALEHLPTVATLDLRMPHFDGFDVIKRLRAEPATQSIFAIALSGDHTAKDRALAAGFDDFCLKPCTPDEVVTKILRFALPLATGAVRGQS